MVIIFKLKKFIFTTNVFSKPRYPEKNFKIIR